MYLYLPVKETLYHPDLGYYESYGLAAHLSAGQLAFLSDVSPDLALVQGLAQQCTAGQLAPSQLEDVVLNLLE